MYDSEKTPVGFFFTDPSDNTNELTAWYIKNLQGDVTGVYVEGEGLAVRYSYDAYGKMDLSAGTVTGLRGILLVMAITYVNPFTYRGYQIDIESYTYYLQSRYYDPQLGRFLNQDAYVDTDQEGFGTNMFAYCENNPVNFADYDGHKQVKIMLITIDQFKKETKNILDDFESIYKKDAKVTMRIISSKAQFIDAWKASNGYDFIVVNTHGSPETIEAKGGLIYLDESDVRKLSSISLKCLILLGCNNGHQAYFYNNVATYFSAKISNAPVVASDGTVYSSRLNSLGLKQKFTSKDDDSWKGYFENKTIPKNNVGWVYYYNQRRYKTEMYSITMKSIINYLKSKKVLSV